MPSLKKELRLTLVNSLVEALDALMPIQQLMPTNHSIAAAMIPERIYLDAIGAYKLFIADYMEYIVDNKIVEVGSDFIKHALFTTKDYPVDSKKLKSISSELTLAYTTAANVERIVKGVAKLQWLLPSFDQLKKLGYFNASFVDFDIWRPERAPLIEMLMNSLVRAVKFDQATFRRDLEHNTTEAVESLKTICDKAIVELQPSETTPLLGSQEKARVGINHLSRVFADKTGTSRMTNFHVFFKDLKESMPRNEKLEPFIDKIEVELKTIAGAKPSA